VVAALLALLAALFFDRFDQTGAAQATVDAPATPADVPRTVAQGPHYAGMYLALSGALLVVAFLVRARQLST
jgi:hypothetical protein